MLSNFVIEQVVKSQKARLDLMETGLPRYIADFSDFSSHALIVSGIRRCGKSTWLQQTRNKEDQPSIYINFEDPRLAGFDLGDLNRLQELAEKEQVMTYFFDEIQIIENWESFVRFRLDEGYRIYITGSNASMLSKELGTKLTGRHITKEIFPFSFNEFLTFKGQMADEFSVTEYLKSGGFPEFLKTNIPEVLVNIFSDIIIRDIAVRHSIKNASALQQLAVWLVSNIGKPFTANSLRKIFDISSSSSIVDYLSFFLDAYLFFYIPKFSYSHKVQIVNPKKIYCIDNGLVETNSASFSDDRGRLLENMVYMQLRRQFTDIFYFSEKRECDFVVFQRGKLQGIYQVCWQLDQNNMDRELEGLIEAMNFFDVITSEMITLNQTDDFEISGKKISVVPFHEWAVKF